MPNITAVKLTGFQLHEDSVIHLGPGMNVITGPSGSGKTTIIRAIRWVAFNDPTGEAFVNKKVGYTEVTLVLDNGIEVTKIRKNSKTRYTLTGYEEPFEKAEVPLEIKQALGLSKHTFGDFETALNFSFQLDAPFLISETASAGAKILGKLAGTEVVDLAVRDVSKDTHAARTARGEAEKEVERINGALLHYVGLEESQRQLESSEYLVSVIDEKLERKGTLEGLISKSIFANDLHQRVTQTVGNLNHIPRLVHEMAQIEKAQQRHETLVDLSDKWLMATFKVSRNTAELERYQGLEATAEQLAVIYGDNERLASLTTISTLYTGYTQAVQISSERLKQLEGVDTLGVQLTTIEEQEIRRIKLVGIAVSWKFTAGVKAGTESKLTALQGLLLLWNKFRDVEELVERQQSFEALRDKYYLSVGVLSTATRQQGDAVSAIAKADSELETVWEEAGGVCPLCEVAHERGTH